MMRGFLFHISIRLGYDWRRTNLSDFPFFKKKRNPYSTLPKRSQLNTEQYSIRQKKNPHNYYILIASTVKNQFLSMSSPRENVLVRVIFISSTSTAQRADHDPESLPFVVNGVHLRII